MSTTIHGKISFGDGAPDVLTTCVLVGTLVISMEYTFVTPLTADEALAHCAVTSVTRTGLFEGPVMSDDGLRAYFSRRPTHIRPLI